MSAVPPELMSAEEREARAAEIQADIPRQWVRFAIAEWVFIWIPFGAFGILYAATDAVGDGFLVPVAVAFGAGAIALTLYWYLFRIRPLSLELERIEGP
jgi:hypothetical protein